MSDPLIAILLFIGFLLAVGAARVFRTLDFRFWEVAGTPLVVGAVTGPVIHFAPVPSRLHPILIGVVLTLAALYVRMTGDESEPADGMTLGALTGATAGVVAVVIAGEGEYLFAAALLAGAVAGFGVTVASRFVAMPLRQIVIDVLTAGAAAAAAMVPAVTAGYLGWRPLDVAIAAAVSIPLLILLTVAVQWTAVRRELADEANLGVIDHADARRAAHPFLRFVRRGWNDGAAYRQFVRLAHKMALRKKQQRSRSGELARIYQLEIIKLRMQMQEMKQLDRASRAATPSHDESSRSDTIDA
jgi:hypothetical protein